MNRARPSLNPLKLNFTNAIKLTNTVPLALVMPAMASNIGPGSHLLIEIPGAGTFGCTANFVWQSGGTRYLGGAGSRAQRLCWIPMAVPGSRLIGIMLPR